jgi:hypothetical protein
MIYMMDSQRTTYCTTTFRGRFGTVNDLIPLSLAPGLLKKRLMSYRAGADT